MAAESGAGGGFLQKFRLYETRSKFYMIGRDKSRTQCRVLTIDRLEPSELSIREDPTMYSEAECYDLLKRIHDGNRATGGLKLVTKCYGIVGFVKFLGPYYMLLITKRRKIGTICGHVVYTVSKSEIITIPSPTIRSNMAYSKDENRSFVHSACKNCVMPGVLLMKAIISSKLETCRPLVLWGFIVMNSYSFLGINHLNCSGLIFLLYYYIIVAVILLTLYLFRTSICVVCNHFRELEILQFFIQFSLFYP